MQNTITQLEHSSFILSEAKTISNRYDYNRVLRFLDQKGKDFYGPKFQLQHEDIPTILKLASYFLQDTALCEDHGIDLRKGIMLTGPIGCGKTTLMNLFRLICNQEDRFVVKSARDITFEFIQDGYETIHRYSRGKIYASEFRNYCFDDLGTEKNMKHFGNECNVLAEILLSRYDLFVAGKLKTHITTNLSATELEEAYGNRLRSRLREMVNLIGFDMSVQDKRK